MKRVLLVLALAATPVAAAIAQERDTTPPEAYFGVTEFHLARIKLERLMQPGGFTVYIIADMEGLAAVVNNSVEMRPSYRGGTPEHERFRQELTDEVNAAIAGARLAGATQFVVNEGHGGTLFRNVLVEQLDPAAILIRGYPKPNVMETGLNPQVDAMFIIGAHANAGTPGIISHNFAFDSFTVNGKPLNEAGIAAFVGGEMGVPLALAAGDNVLTAETREMVGPLETVTVKLAESRSAAAVFSPATVRGWIRQAAGRAVRRVRGGAIKPLVFERPYHVRLCLRPSYEAWVPEEVARLPGLTREGDSRCLTTESQSAEDVVNVLNKIEWIVLKP